MKINLKASSLISAFLSWVLLSGLTFFIIYGMRDRARLIRDNDNERILNTLFASLRSYDDFGTAIESSAVLKGRVIGLAFYRDDLGLEYSWGNVPSVFDKNILKDVNYSRNGRYTIPNINRQSVCFVLHFERPTALTPPVSPPPPMPPGMGMRQQRSFTTIRTNGEGQTGEVRVESVGTAQTGIRSATEKDREDEPENSGEKQEQNGNRQGFWFFSAWSRGMYIYIDIFHPAYWRTRILTTVLFPVCIGAILFLALYIRGLYLRNYEYRERIEGQKSLVVLGTAASTLAHEIKNPLLSIRLQTGILNKILSGTGKEEIAIINEEVERLSALIYRVNDYLRDPAGNPEPVNSYSLLCEISLRLCGRNIVEGDACRNSMVFMDADRLRSVLENVIRNALESGSGIDGISALISRFSQAGGGASGDRIVISILDRGRGMAREDLGRIFDPFFTRKSAGTGIGLSISKRFAEAAGGNISIENREGGGAVVKICLNEYRGAVRL
ncbi:MAG: HAMP domain-containing histidine kinase [Treponema sp.]|jgi:two-component system sensor histidine kinase HydH|nr:HAMP domain-containing histidine kinase [Treponema sp.]